MPEILSQVELVTPEFMKTYGLGATVMLGVLTIMFKFVTVDLMGKGKALKAQAEFNRQVLQSSRDMGSQLKWLMKFGETTQKNDEKMITALADIATLMGRLDENVRTVKSQTERR